jgi:transcriptional regulator with XRE-family HTH domain
MPKHKDISQNLIVGANLKSLRQGAGMTMEDVAALLDVTFQQIQKYESGASAVPLAALPILADAFGVSADVFFEQDATFPGGVETDHDVMSLCFTIVAVHDPALRRKIRRVVEILAA